MPAEDPEEGDDGSSHPSSGAGEREDESSGDQSDHDGHGRAVPDDGGNRGTGGDRPPGADRSPNPDEGDRSGESGEPDRHGSESSPQDSGAETSRPTAERSSAEPGARTGEDSGDGDGAGAPGAREALIEMATSVGTVLLVGLLLFVASGVWPPLVAVESGSMEPHMSRGDLVFVSDSGRYAPDTAVEGVVTYRQGRETGYWSFGDYGNVIVFQPDGKVGTPIIHRARFYVEEGENWVKRADPQFLGGTTCAENVHCPAEHDGFITKGDANPRYDQVGSTKAEALSNVVRPEWIRGNGKFRVPKLGCIRLELSGIGCDYGLQSPLQERGESPLQATVQSPLQRSAATVARPGPAPG